MKNRISNHQPLSNRRNILKLLGLSISGVSIGACLTAESAALPDLGSGDVGIMNLALILETLEADYYSKVMASPYQGMNRMERDILGDIGAHEIAHRDFFRKLLGSSAVTGLVFDFSKINFSSRESVLVAARNFEDLGVAAYNGAANEIRDAAVLAAAGSIVSVEGRHAAVIRSLLDPFSASFAPTALDDAYNPPVVKAKVAPFIA